MARYKSGSTLAGVIYIHRISDGRFTGASSRNFGMFRKLCGDTTLKNVIFLTNMWGTVTKDVGEAREKQLTTKFFKPALDKGAQLARHYNTPQSARDVIRRIMKNQPIPLQIQRELVDEHKDITDTAAGEAINKEIKEEIRRHQAKLETVKEEMIEAFKNQNEETRQELEEEKRKLQEEVDNMRMKSEGMASEFSQERNKMEEAMRQIQEERERAEAARRQVEDLERRLQEGPNAEMQKRIDDLQHQLNNRPQGGGCTIM